MSTTQTPGRHLQTRLQIQGRLLAAALLLGAGGAMAPPSAYAQNTPNAPSAADRTAGEAPAKAYHAQNPAKFANTAPVITPAQTAAARADGEQEGPRGTSAPARKQALASK